jgi:hypothetical protein
MVFHSVLPRQLVSSAAPSRRFAIATLRQMRRTVPSVFSIELVQPSERLSSAGRPRRLTVNISSTSSECAVLSSHRSAQRAGLPRTATTTTPAPGEHMPNRRRAFPQASGRMAMALDVAWRATRDDVTPGLRLQQPITPLCAPLPPRLGAATIQRRSLLVSRGILASRSPPTLQGRAYPRVGPALARRSVG